MILCFDSCMVYQVASAKILIDCSFWDLLWSLYLILDPEHLLIDGHMTVVYVLIRATCLEGNIDIMVDRRNITYKMVPGAPPIRIQHFNSRCEIMNYFLKTQYIVVDMLTV